jgi:BirA family biotin operon repressor/biotin-[acetyl-CoA-carboxylase] ligase
MPGLGHTIVRVEESESTNTLVLSDESYIGRHGLVIVAQRQTAGRGRMGRTWFSLPGEQLFSSTVVHPTASPADVPAVALIAGLAVARAVAETFQLDARLKWPNDVLIRSRKVAGILVEAKPGAHGQQRLVLGIGVNCQGSTQDAPPELRERITTLSQEAGKVIKPDDVLGALLSRLNALLDRLSAGQKAGLLVEWAKYAHVTGRRVVFPLPKGSGDGVAQGITPEGYLVVEDVAGLRHILVSGEVRWLD